MSFLTMAQVLWTAATLTDLRTSIVFLGHAAQSNEITSIQPTINQIVWGLGKEKFFEKEKTWTYTI